MAKTNNTLNSKEPQVGFFKISKGITPAPISSVAYGKPYISFDNDNLYPQKLSELADGNALHSALLDVIAKWICGNGWIIESESKQSIKAAEEFLKLSDQLDELKRVARDMSYFNGFYLNVLYQNDGKIRKHNHVDFSEVRISKPNPITKVSDSFYHSIDWKIATTRSQFSGENEIYKPLEIAAYDPKKYRDKLSKEYGQIKCVKEYKSGRRPYAEPRYIGALNAIDVGGQIWKMHKSNIENGMLPSYHVHVFEDLSDKDKRRKITDGINENFAGASNAGSIFITWSTDPEVKTILEPLQANNVHEMFIMLNTHVKEEILTAHQVPPFISSMLVKSGFTDAGNAIKESLQWFQNTVISPMQDHIIMCYEDLLSVNGITDVKLDISNLNPITLIGDMNILQRVMTKDEYRTEELGLDPLLDTKKGASLIIETDTSQNNFQIK